MDAGVEAYFDRLRPELRRVALALRAAIEHAGPDLKVKLSHGHPSWHGRTWICSVVVHAAHCNLQLARGVDLADEFPERIEGSGKALRHVKVRSEDDIDGEMEDIIKAAIALDVSGPAPLTARRG